MATIPDTQAQAIDTLESVLDSVQDRSKSFATDLVAKGRKYTLSSKQMYWVKRLADEAQPKDDNDGEASIESTPTPAPSGDDNISELCDELDSLRPYLSHRSQNFAQSLIRQGRNKGWLSSKQMPFVHKMIEEGNEEKTRRADRDARYEAERIARAAKREADRIGTTPVGDDEAEQGYEAVMALFDAAGDTLSRTRIHLITNDDREVVVRSNRRKAESNDVLYVHNHGADHKDRFAQFGHITKATNAYNFTPYADAEVRRVMTLLRDDPLGTVMDMGRKSGRCCFCSLPLTDERSTAHGYGPICAKNYKLAWSHKTAQMIEEGISLKVLEVIIEMNDKGTFQVKDRESGEVIATFDSREAANRFADQFSIVESA
jgi:hypothetical protein